MSDDSALAIDRTPDVAGGTMVLAFSGWMDGGDVSTGTVSRFVELFAADPFARIDPRHFYIYNFPGAMDVAAMFRPHVRVEQGRIVEFEPPENLFHAFEPKRLVFFVGKEPHLDWEGFGDCIFTMVRRTGVARILFVGSFGGTVPHTREPRLYVSASDPRLIAELTPYGVRPADYEGPGSFTTYLMTRAGPEGVDMASLVAEIPGYLQGPNPLSIEAVTRRLATILDVSIDLAELRIASDEWEMQVTEAVRTDDELRDRVRELEESYDQDMLDPQDD